MARNTCRDKQLLSQHVYDSLFVTIVGNNNVISGTRRTEHLALLLPARLSRCECHGANVMAYNCVNVAHKQQNCVPKFTP